jgi:hypothetical protein
MKFLMVHADERGETHFGVKDIQDRELAVGPPPNPTGRMSDVGAVTTMCVISFPAGTEAPAHNAPQPYVVIVLWGEGEVATSDGEARRFCLRRTPSPALVTSSAKTRRKSADALPEQKPPYPSTTREAGLGSLICRFNAGSQDAYGRRRPDRPLNKLLPRNGHQGKSVFLRRHLLAARAFF